MPPTLRQFALSWIGAFALGSAPAMAATLTATVVDAAGRPLNDAAISVEPQTKRAAAKALPAAEIEQKGKQFIPSVSVIQTGTSVSFPNNDTVRHHVYSFSPAKTFELKLYAGTPAKPVDFDKPGTVVIGCNIHDRMVGYIHVVDTPHFVKSDAAGKARLDDLAPGKYILKGWHHSLLPNGQAFEQAVEIRDGNTDIPIRIGGASAGDGR